MPDPKNKKASKLKAMAKPVMMERNTKVPSKLNVKAPSKEEVESKIGRIKELQKDVEDQRQGKAEFGEDYEDLGLKLKSTGIKRVGDDVERDAKGEVKFRRTFSGKEDGVSETVTKEYGGDILRVNRTSPKAYGSGTETEVFNETVPQRKKRVYEQSKMRVMRMLEKARNQKPEEPTRAMSDENVAKLAAALKNKNK